jgi:hypothetical protein
MREWTLKRSIHIDASPVVAGRTLQEYNLIKIIS